MNVWLKEKYKNENELPVITWDRGDCIGWRTPNLREILGDKEEADAWLPVESAIAWGGEVIFGHVRIVTSHWGKSVGARIERIETTQSIEIYNHRYMSVEWNPEKGKDKCRTLNKRVDRSLQDSLTISLE